MRYRALALVAVLPLGALRAQLADGDRAAAVALRASHLGALTPLMTPAMVSRSLDGAQLALRYGLRDERGTQTHAFGASAVFGIGLKSSVALNAGVYDADCPACSPQLMLGIGGDMRVLEAAEFLGSANSLSLAVAGDIGFARIGEPDADPTASGIVLGVGAPITLVIGRRTAGMRISPFFTPMLGIGQAEIRCPGGCDETDGTRMIFGGGIGFWNPETSVSVTLGIQHVSGPDARPVYGVNVLLGGR